MAFKIILLKKAEKALDRLPEVYRLRVISSLREIRIFPFAGKKLSGDRDGQYSFRVWPYRIIYKIEKRELVIIVIDIDHRQSVYKK